MFNKTLSDLKNNTSSRVQGKIGVLADPNGFMNDIVNGLHGMIDIRSMIRSARVLPSSVEGISKYQIPIDVKGNRVIDLPTQIERQFSEFDLVTPEQFKIKNRDADFAVEYINRHPALLFKNTSDAPLTITSFPSDADWDTNIKTMTSLIEFVATNTIKDNSLTGELGFIQDVGSQIIVSGTVSNDGTYTIASITDDNTIEVVETVINEVSANTTITGGDDLEFKEFNFTDYFKGNSSLQIEDTPQQLDMETFLLSTDDITDITSFLRLESSLHLRAKIDNSENISNITVRLGNDANNYYSVSGLYNSFNDGNIQDGWNLFAFDFFRDTHYDTTISQTGSPIPTGIQYVSVIISKNDKTITHKILLDEILLQKGTLYDIKYYSSFPWIDGDTGERKQLATKEIDILVCDADEYELFRKHISFEMAVEAELSETKIDRLEKWRNEEFIRYGINYPSKAKPEINTYMDYGR